MFASIFQQLFLKAKKPQKQIGTEFNGSRAHARAIKPRPYLVPLRFIILLSNVPGMFFLDPTYIFS